MSEGSSDRRGKHPELGRILRAFTYLQVFVANLIRNRDHSLSHPNLIFDLILLQSSYVVDKSAHFCLARLTLTYFFHVTFRLAWLRFARGASSVAEAEALGRAVALLLAVLGSNLDGLEGGAELDEGFDAFEVVLVGGDELEGVRD